MKKSLPILTILTLGLLAASGPAMAQNGCTPLFSFGPNTVFVGDPGCYVLTQDLAAGQPLLIQTLGTLFPNRPVDIDLAGHSITATQFAAVQINGPCPVIIRNGTLIGSTTGLGATGSRRLVARNLTIMDTSLGGIGMSDVREFLIEDVLIDNGGFGGGGDGIFVASSGTGNRPVEAGTIRRAQILDTAQGIDLVDVRDFHIQDVHINNALSGGDGIIVSRTGLIAGMTGTIEDSDVVNAAAGIDVQQADSLSIVDNRLDNLTGMGIFVALADDVIIQDNAVSNVTANVGIFTNFVQSGRVAGNVVNNTFSHGIMVWDTIGSRIVDNSVTNAGGTGFWFVASDANRIAGNTMSGNAGPGLLLGTGADNNVYSANVALGNGGTACANPEFCDQGTNNQSPNDNFMPTQL